MSKQELQQAAFRNSGVTYEESLEASNLDMCLFERIGREEGFLTLSQLFYDRVFDDTENRWFLGIFASSTKAESVDNQYRFLVQTFGGPDLYKQKKGKYTRLAGRHAAYNIGTSAAHQWVNYMTEALKEHETLSTDDEARASLLKYFTYTAHYIVAASVYMRPDQLSGGTQIDPGRIW